MFMGIRIFSFSILIFCTIFLTACHSSTTLQGDTVIPIPMRPTTVTEESQESFATDASPVVPEETADIPSTHMEKDHTKTSSHKKPHTSHSSKPKPSKPVKPTKPSLESSSTEPPVTAPPATEPPVTEPSVTEPPATEAPAPQPTEADPSKPSWYDPSIYNIQNHTTSGQAYAIIDEINRLRSENDLPAFASNNKLCAISHVRAYEISLCWSHSRPDGRGYTTALSDYGYSFGSAAENLLATNCGSSASAVVSQWMSSDAQQANILSENFRHIGVSLYQTNGNTYVACFFTS